MADTRQEVLAREEDIDNLNAKNFRLKTELKEKKREYEEVKEELDTIHYRIDRQQQRLNMFETENMKKLDEIDRLMLEADKSKDELARLHRTYNFDMIDKMNSALAAYANWSAKFVP